MTSRARLVHRGPLPEALPLHSPRGRPLPLAPASPNPYGSHGRHLAARTRPTAGDIPLLGMGDALCHDLDALLRTAHKERISKRCRRAWWDRCPGGEGTDETSAADKESLSILRAREKHAMSMRRQVRAAVARSRRQVRRRRST